MGWLERFELSISGATIQCVYQLHHSHLEPEVRFELTTFGLWGRHSYQLSYSGIWGTQITRCFHFLLPLHHTAVPYRTGIRTQTFSLSNKNNMKEYSLYTSYGGVERIRTSGPRYQGQRLSRAPQSTSSATTPNGAPGWNWTIDAWLFRPTLYQLSYQGLNCSHLESFI